MSTYRETLRALTKEGLLYAAEQDKGVRCYACGHRCFIPENFEGICKVRFNEGGKLKVPWGYVGGLQLDPVEKKPFFHVRPGSRALSFGMLGCDLHCGYCQNWITSQALRDENAKARPLQIEADALVQMALDENAAVLTSTYNEPLITSEWAIEIFKKGKEKGLLCSYVSNGNATKEVLEFIRPYVDLYKIDLKSFNDKRYRSLGGVLKNVTDSIELVHKMGFWIEIVTLLVPGFNDDPAELKELTQFLASISRNIPWHATGFHQDYKMRDRDATSLKTLEQAERIGKDAGLNFVYLGNRPGQLPGSENTVCPECQTVLIERVGFKVTSNQLANGECPNCQLRIPGVW